MATTIIVGIKDIGRSVKVPTFIKMDNQSTMRLIRNPVYHKRTKHIEIRFHFVREKFERGEIDIDYICSEYQLADILTKALPRDRFSKLRELIGIMSCKE